MLSSPRSRQKTATIVVGVCVALGGVWATVLTSDLPFWPAKLTICSVYAVGAAALLYWTFRRLGVVVYSCPHGVTVPIESSCLYCKIVLDILNPCAENIVNHVNELRPSGDPIRGWRGITNGSTHAEILAAIEEVRTNLDYYLKMTRDLLDLAPPGSLDGLGFYKDILLGLRDIVECLEKETDPGGKKRQKCLKLMEEKAEWFRSAVRSRAARLQPEGSELNV